MHPFHDPLTDFPFMANYIFDDVFHHVIETIRIDHHMNQSDWPILMVLAILVTCTFRHPSCCQNQYKLTILLNEFPTILSLQRILHYVHHE